MTTLRDEIVADLDGVLKDWASVSRETQNDLRDLDEYYSNVEKKTKAEVIEQARNDHEKFESHLKKHQSISAKATNAARDLKTQVETSGNSVKKMKNYGLKTAILVTVLGGAIGLGIGVKSFGQPIAIFVAVLVGIISFGCVAFVTYFVLKTLAERKAKMWKMTESENQQGLEIAKVIAPKRRCLADMSSNLEELEENNFESGITALLENKTEYLDDM